MTTPYAVRHRYSSLIAAKVKPFILPTFIETGSNTGYGIEVALECGASTVYSIEALTEYFAICADRFGRDPRVHLIPGESPAALIEVLQSLDERATIYLDAHTEAVNPLLDELRAILWTGKRRDHTILIDDVRMFGTSDWHGIQKREALELLWEINPRYVLSYVDTTNAPADLLVAQVTS